MNRSFSSLNARAICHSTEDVEKVRQSMLNALGEIELHVSVAKGHHGNPMEIIEARTEKMREIDGFFKKMQAEDLEVIDRTIESRIDDACNLFLRLSKQDAFHEIIRLATDDDAIAIRIKIRAYPAKRESAIVQAREYLATAQDKLSSA
ncbi:MAG: exosome subunit [Candidatus Thermoplasmatota archaeon]|nr:exosome subunit [Candidatus Thermoplasmatota archaeon]